MQKKFLIYLLIFILFITFSFSVARAENSDSYLRVSTAGNVYGGGADLKIDNNTEGDLVLAGSVITINGNVSGDVIAAGGTVLINGNVQGDVRAAGGMVKINGDVGGDLVAAGGELAVSEKSRIGGDLFFTGGDITVDGAVAGNGFVSAGTFRAGEKFKIAGDLDLQAENIPENLGSKVGGTYTYVKSEKAAEKPAWGFSFFSFFIGLLASLALGWILIYFFPDFVVDLSETVRSSALKAGLIGFLMLIALPLLALILLVTVFGWSLSVLLLLLAGLALLISTVPVKLLAGELIYTKLFNRKAGPLLYYLVGVVVFALAYAIPLLGGLIKFIALLLGFGAIWIRLSGHAQSKKPSF